MVGSPLTFLLIVCSPEGVVQLSLHSDQSSGTAQRRLNSVRALAKLEADKVVDRRRGDAGARISLKCDCVAVSCHNREVRNGSRFCAMAGLSCGCGKRHCSSATGCVHTRCSRIARAVRAASTNRMPKLVLWRPHSARAIYHTY